MAISPNEILILGGQIGTHEDDYFKGNPIGMSDIHILYTDNDTLTREKENTTEYTCYTN